MATATKAQLVNENIAVRSENDRLRAVITDQHFALADLKDKVAKLTAGFAAVDTNPRTAFADFCAAYCREHSVRSVPGNVAKAWRANPGL